MSEKILIAEDEELIREMIAIMMAEKFDVEVFEADGANPAIEILKKNKIDLIISDLNMPDGSGDELYLYNRDHGKAAFIFVSSVDLQKYDNLKDYYQQDNHYYLSKPFTEDQLFSIFESIFHNEDVAKDTSEISTEKDRYTSIPIELTHCLSEDIGEILIKINDQKYLKYLDKVDHGDSTKFQKLKDKGCEEVFVHADQYHDWINLRLKDIKTNLKKLNGTIQSNQEVLNSVIQLSRIIFNVGSFPDFLVKEFETAVDHILTDLWSNRETQEMTQLMFSEKTLVQVHSSICLFLCKLINSKINLNDKAKFKKLALASLFHDIALKSEDSLQMLSFDQLEAQNLSQVKKEMILSHARNSAKQLEAFPIFDLDTLDMIKNHHELPHELGYPNRLDLKSLKVLSRQFNLAHYVSHVISKSANFTKSDYFAIRDIFDDEEFLILLDTVFDYFNASNSA